MFFYPTASATAYGQRPKFVRAEHSATAEGENCAYGPTLTGKKIYRTRAIITRSRFETALDYKPRIFKVRKVSLYYKPLCNINRGLSHIFSFFNLNYTLPFVQFFMYCIAKKNSERSKKFFHVLLQICRFSPFFILVLFTLLSKGRRKNRVVTMVKSFQKSSIKKSSLFLKCSFHFVRHWMPFKLI